MDLNKYVKECAGKLKIDMCGITDYKIDRTKLDYLDYRVRNNLSTEFEEQDLELRTNKNLSLDGAGSIIVVGMSYNTEAENIELYPKGKLSKISYGEDYHRVLRTKLEELVEELSKSLDFDYKIYVDTGPLIDRELAYLAGIGYYGKNCSIINEDYGSFIALGYIITSLEIENDRPLESQCGDCRLCLDACPTQALYKAYKLNPKICISYLTQAKNIPEDLRPKMGIKIYGCDTCQLVCPKNKGVRTASERAFIPEKTKGYVDILELMEMSNRDFREKYGSMSGSWKGKNTLKRNALIVLSNLGDKSFLPALKYQAKSESNLIRDYARWALETIKED